MASPQSTQAIASGDLLELVSSSASATIYPTDDALLSVLQARFRADLPYTRIGSTHLVVVNPYKTLANVNDASAKDYEERCYKDTNPAVGVDAPRPLQPHLYDMAAKMYLLLRRKKEAQAIVARYVILLELSFSFFVRCSFPRTTERRAWVAEGREASIIGVHLISRPRGDAHQSYPFRATVPFLLSPIRWLLPDAWTPSGPSQS